MRARCAWLAGLVGTVILTTTASRGAISGQASWYVGEKIVCVNNRFLDLSDAPELTEGAVYTVRQVLPPRRGFLGLAIVETPAKAAFQAFDERRFRPLDVSASRFLTGVPAFAVPG